MKKLVMVETISQHRVRYVVEVEDELEHALDEVVCREHDIEFKEFSQMHLGNIIVSHRQISEDEYIKIFNEDNDYLGSWSDDDKKKLINVIAYESKELNDGT
jgi:hypothetical protein